MRSRLLRVGVLVWVALLACAPTAQAQPQAHETTVEKGSHEGISEQWRERDLAEGSRRRDVAEAILRAEEESTRARRLGGEAGPGWAGPEGKTEHTGASGGISSLGSTLLRLQAPPPPLRVERATAPQLATAGSEIRHWVSERGPRFPESVVASRLAHALSELDVGSWDWLPAWRRAEICRQLDVLSIHRLTRAADQATTRVILRQGAEVIVLDHVHSGPGRDRVTQRPPDVIWEDLAASLASYATKLVRPFAVQGVAAGGVRLHVPGGTIELTPDELSRLAAGRQLGPEHALTRFLSEADIDTDAGAVLYPDPLSERDDTAEASAIDALVATLQQAYPRARVLREPLRTDSSAATTERIKRIVAFDRGVAHRAEAVIPPVEVRDYNVMANFKDYLAEEGVEVLDFHAGSIATAREAKGLPDSALFLMGHSDKHLADLVGRLGRAGHFVNKYVIFQTCETPLTRQLKTEIVEKYFAIGVSSFIGEIEPAHVGGFLNDVAPWISGHAVIDGGLRGFLRRSAVTHGLKPYDSALERVTFAPRG